MQNRMSAAGRSIFAFLLAALLLPASVPAQPAPPTPYWIWRAAQSQDGETVYFRKTFESAITNPDQLKSAMLWGTCDNRLTVYLNGKQVARNGSWERPFNVDVKPAIQLGANTIAVQGVNTDSSIAGLILRLRLTYQDGRQLDV